MKGIEHLTKNQIAGYRTGAFDALEKRKIGRHLLKCESCRRSLPAPTFDDFWNAVMNERETEQTLTTEKSELSRHTIFSYFPKVFGQFNALAWSGATLTVLVSFSLLLWLNAANRWNQEREVAQTFNSNSNEFNPAQIDSGERVLAPAQNSRVAQQALSFDSNGTGNPKSSPQREPQKNLNSSLQTNASRNSVRQIPAGKRDTISSTRGGVLPADCNNETSVETEIGLSGEAVTLKWKKIPNAVKYHLYVSDDEEILIEEFETAQETSYVMKKNLVSSKDYMLKILVTLEDRKTIVADSRKFNIKDLHTERNKTEMKKKNDVRCTQTKLLGRG